MALNLLPNKPNNPMTFTENQHGTAVLEKLRSQREHLRCCDVILHVAGKQFQAHRCVLGACSPYFDSIFKANKTVKEQLTFSSQDPEVFRCLLAYMYTGTVVIDKTNVAELLRLANKLLIAKLKEHCAEYLERYLDVTNCLTVRDMATKFNLSALEKTARSFIQSHLANIIEGDEVLSLSLARLEDILTSPSWKLLHEEKTLLLVTRWVHHNPNSRERNLRSLLTWVQWCRINVQTAIELIKSHPLYSGSNSLLALFFLLDALHDNSLLPDDFLAPYHKLKTNFTQTDTVVDNESFLKLAISTAIDEFQEEQLTSSKPQEAPASAKDFSTHGTGLAHSSQDLPSGSEEDSVNGSVPASNSEVNGFQVHARRCEVGENEQHQEQHQEEQQLEEQQQQQEQQQLQQEEQQQQQHLHYDGCLVDHNPTDVHLSQPVTDFSQVSFSSLVGLHRHVSDDPGEESTAADINEKFVCGNDGHFGQPPTRNIGGAWHQESQYVAEESLSSDSCHIYQREVYDKVVNMKVPCTESYNARINAPVLYTHRDNTVKTKQGFSSAVSYYVSNYNPDDDMTLSDDQSAQSFPYDDTINSALNFYTCRSAEVKDSQGVNIDPQNEGNYGKSYYQNESISTQNINCQQQDIYYNENSTDTRLSNCPQDMTIQHHFQQNLEVKQHPELVGDSVDVHVSGSLPKELHIEESQYDQYGSENSGIDEAIHKNRHRIEDDKYVFMGQRHISSHEISRAEERLGLDNDFQNRDVETFEEESMTRDRSFDGSTSEMGYKEPSSYGRIASESVYSTQNYKNFIHDEECLLTHNTQIEEDNVQESSSYEEAVPQKYLNSLSDPEDNTPRHVQFKINRRMNMCSSDLLPTSNQGDILSSHSSMPCNNNAVASNDACDDPNPDDPAPVADALVIDLHNSDKEEEEEFDSRSMKIDHCYKEEANCRQQRTEDKLSASEVKKPSRRIRIRANLLESNKGEKKNSATQKECDICKASFVKREYFVHMKTHFPGPPHQCDTCDSTFKRIYHLLDHRVIHQEVKGHKCPHCSFSTHKKYNLTEHMENHFSSGKYKCKICGSSFYRLQVLRVHETKHTNERPFLCETCGWSGKTKNALIIHIKLHTGELLRCQFPNCTYSTPKKSHLTEHMHHHTKSRPFACEVCERSFITSSHLRRHMKVHLAEKPFKCSQCDYCSSRGDRLKSHMNTKHSKKTGLKVPLLKQQGRKRTSAAFPKTNLKTASQKHRGGKKKSTAAPKDDASEEIMSGIDCSQADIFSDLENTNVSLQPQLPTTPPPTTLSEYPTSPPYTFQSQSAADDSLMMDPGMSSVADGFTQLPHTSPLHRSLGANLSYEGNSNYQASPSQFATLSPTHSTLSYVNGHQGESPLNFAAYMKYD